MLKTRIGRIKLFTPCFMLNLAMLVTSVLCLCYLVPSILTEAAIKQYDPFAVRPRCPSPVEQPKCERNK